MDVPASRPESFVARALPALIVIAAIAFIAVPAFELIVPGPFHWHLQQTPVVQGGLEGIALIVLFAAGFRHGSRTMLVLLVLLPALFYLRRHAVDLPLLVDAFCVETVFALGALARRLSGAAPAHETQPLLHDFVLGFCVWSAAAWSLSAFGVGSVIDLRWLTLALAVVAFAARPRLFVVHLGRRLRDADRSTRALCGALLGAGLVLFARTAVVTGFDSLWYGLRPEYVLVADGSAFRGLGLVSPVYYFPKLYELFLTPLAGLGSTSVMIGIGVWLLLLVGLVSRRILLEIGVARLWNWLGVALIVTLPAVANTALSTKPDMLALLLMLLALLNGIQYLDRRDPARLVWFMTAALLATQAKLTAIPYVGVLGIVLLALALRSRAIPEASSSDVPIDRGSLRLASVAFVLALATAGFVTARTWLLAGMPTIGPDPLFAIWRALGMSLTPPAGTLHWTRPQDWSDVPALLVDELFRPEVLPHIAVSWLGNVWLYLALIAMAASVAGDARPLRDRSRWLLAALMATGFALLIGWRYSERGSDGNYFAVAAVAAIVCTLAAATRRLAQLPLALRTLAISLGAFACFHAAYAFTSGGWTAGTRRFDLDLSRSVQPRREERWRVLGHAGLTKIADHLRQGARVRRVVGCIDGGTIGFRLPFRYEDLVMIGYSRAEYLADAPAFLAFLRANRIDAVILPRTDRAREEPEEARRMLAMLPELEAVPGVRRIDDDRYLALDFSSSPSMTAAAGAERARTPANR